MMGTSVLYPRLTAAFDDGARASRHALWWESAGNLVNGALSQIVVVAMIVLTSSLAASGTMEPLVAIAVIGMCLRFTTMLDDIGAAVMGVEERRQMMNHLDAVMDAELMAEPQEPSSLPEPGVVELDDVVFGYRPDAPVLTGVSMSVLARDCSRTIRYEINSAESTMIAMAERENKKELRIASDIFPNASA